MATPAVLPIPTGLFKAGAQPGAQAAAFAQVKHDYGLFFAGEVGGIVQNLPAQAHIVEGLLTHSSVNILVGDSGTASTTSSPTPFFTS